MSRLTLIGVAAIVVSLAVVAPAAGKHAFWQTPSKRIHCAWFSPPSFLRCDIDGGLRPKPSRPASCRDDFGQGLEMSRTGRSKVVCAGDSTNDPSARVLAYGTNWKRGGFTCKVRTTGVRCTNASGHGFFLSRERWSRF
ncbi:MAG: DUF6636 domain-containing protein [Gaiellales bacterium]